MVTGWKKVFYYSTIKILNSSSTILRRFSRASGDSKISCVMVVGISGIMTCITEIGCKVNIHPRTLDVRVCEKIQKKCIF